MGNSKSKSTAPATLNGLYASCAWDSKTIRMLVASKRIAPLYPGATEETRVTPAGSTASDHSTPTGIVPADYEEECPICFLYYKGGMNRTTCCKKAMCTECFLQVKPPAVKVPCPFCNSDALFVKYRGPLSVREIAAAERERAAYEDAEARLLDSMRSGSSERQLEEADWRHSADLAVTAAAARERAASEASAVAPASVESANDSDTSASQSDDGDNGSGAPLASAAIRVAGGSPGAAGSPASQFFGRSPDHVPEHLENAGMSLMQLEQALLDEAIRQSLANAEAAAPAAPLADDDAPDGEAAAAAPEAPEQEPAAPAPMTVSSLADSVAASSSAAAAASAAAVDANVNMKARQDADDDSSSGTSSALSESGSAASPGAKSTSSNSANSSASKKAAKKKKRAAKPHVQQMMDDDLVGDVSGKLVAVSDAGSANAHRTVSSSSDGGSRKAAPETPIKARSGSASASASTSVSPRSSSGAMRQAMRTAKASGGATSKKSGKVFHSRTNSTTSEEHSASLGDGSVSESYSSTVDPRHASLTLSSPPGSSTTSCAEEMSDPDDEIALLAAGGGDKAHKSPNSVAASGVMRKGSTSRRRRKSSSHKRNQLREVSDNAETVVKP